MKNEEKLKFIKEAIDIDKINNSTTDWYYNKTEDIKKSLDNEGFCNLKTNLEYEMYDEFFKSLEGLEKIIKNNYIEEKENILKFVNDLENAGYLRDEIFNNEYAKNLEKELRYHINNSKVIKLFNSPDNTQYDLQILKIKEPISKEEFREVLLKFYTKYNPDYFEVRYREIESEKNRITRTNFYYDYLYTIQEIEGDEYKNPLDQHLLNWSTNNYSKNEGQYETIEDYIDEVFFERMYVEEYEYSTINDGFQPYASAEEEERDRIETFRLMQEETEKEMQELMEKFKRRETELIEIINLEKRSKDINNKNKTFKIYSDEEVAKEIINRTTKETKSEYIIDESEWSMARFDKNILNYVKSVRLEKESEMMTEEEFNNLVESLNLEKPEYRKRFLARKHTKEEAADELFLKYYKSKEIIISYKRCYDEIRYVDVETEMTEKEFEKYITNIINLFSDKVWEE